MAAKTTGPDVGLLGRLAAAAVTALGGDDAASHGIPSAFPIPADRLPELLLGLDWVGLGVLEPAGGRLVVARAGREEAHLPDAALAVARAAGLEPDGPPAVDNAAPAVFLGDGTHVAIEVDTAPDDGGDRLLVVLNQRLRDDMPGLGIVASGRGPQAEIPLGDGGDGPDLDVIMDIPLEVTVRLGRSRRRLGEILALSAGSVIELDRQAGEAVDIMVNGRLLARGEVVIIDGNFGVRITDISSPKERVTQLS